MVPGHGTNMKKNPSSHHEGMHKDARTDTDEPDMFLYSPLCNSFPDSTIAEQGIITQVITAEKWQQYQQYQSDLNGRFLCMILIKPILNYLFKDSGTWKDKYGKHMPKLYLIERIDLYFAGTYVSHVSLSIYSQVIWYTQPETNITKLFKYFNVILTSLCRIKYSRQIINPV